MALPDKPLTRRETYLAKAAGQAVTLPETDLTREELYLRAIAEGGGGGGVTPEYVAEAITEAKTDIEAEIPTKTSDLTNDSGYAAIDDTVSALDKAYSSAKVEEKVAGEEITTTATGSDLTLSTSSGSLNALTVYGKSEVVDGAIVSAGEGYAVVRLADLTWLSGYDGYYANNTIGAQLAPSTSDIVNAICNKYTTTSYSQSTNKTICGWKGGNCFLIKDDYYTTLSDFVASLGDATICYQLADPTQGNAIAIKADNGSGIDGIMAVFSTGTPLRGIPNGAKDVAEWDGSSGEVTKNCGTIKLKNIITAYSSQYQFFFSGPITGLKTNSQLITPKYNYIGVKYDADMGNAPNMSIAIAGTQIKIKDTDYTTVEDFVASLGDAELVYELATPTTEQLTTTENNSIAGLRTFAPNTHAQNNAGATMTVEAYTGTANGKAMQELKQGVQSEISALKITQSDTLTLTVADWSSNQQTVSYAHDTAKRNVIDVDPASVEEWANCGVLATAETASGITFTCKTVPENALNFRVTSMGVN